MGMIECFSFGTDTRHTDEHYFVRRGLQDTYLIMFFKTPFLYKKDGEVHEGEEMHYLINPPYSVTEHGSHNVGFVNDWIFVRGEMAEKIISKFKLPLSTPFKIGEHSILYPYIKKIAGETVLKHTGYEYRLSALVTDMLVTLGRQYEISQKKEHPAYSDVFKARAYMLNNIEKRITLEELAEFSHYSKSHFCALYNEFFGSSPIEDLLGARIEKAAALLEYGEISVNEAAKLCGFSTINYFSRKFKEKMGCSPSKYMK